MLQNTKLNIISFTTPICEKSISNHFTISVHNKNTKKYEEEILAINSSKSNFPSTRNKFVFLVCSPQHSPQSDKYNICDGKYIKKIPIYAN